MSKVEQLTCPACGAHDVSQISGINYQCNYCHSTFIVKEDNPSSKFNKSGPTFSGLSKEEILEKLKKGEFPFSTGSIDFSTESTETFSTTFTDIKKTVVTPTVKPAKIAGIIVAMVVIALVGVGVAVFTLTNKVTSGAKKFFSGWQKPSIDSYNCLVGSKGAVVWLVLKTQTNKLDSAKCIIRLVDPITKKIIVEEPLGKTTTWKETFHQSKQFDSEFYVVNDTAYNISEDGGVQGFDLYTGKKLFGNEWLETKYPQLKDGIDKVDKENYKKRVKLSTASGDDFYYYPDTKLLIGKKEQDKSDGENPVFSEDIYLSHTKKSQLYLCNIKRRKDDDFYVSESYVEQFKSNLPNTYSNIKTIKPIGEAVYAKALPIQENDNKLLFFYASDFSKHADGVLAVVNKEGSFSWKNNDESFKSIITENTNDHLYLDYSLNKDLIVITINKDGYQSVGVDLKTGKTQFVFQQSHSLD